MGNKLLLIATLLASTTCHAGDFYVFAGAFAFHEGDTLHDYSGLSPIGYYGIKYEQPVTENFSATVGYKHESSMGYREVGEGFNGWFFESQLRIF